MTPEQAHKHLANGGVAALNQAVYAEQFQRYARLETAARAVVHGLHTMPTEQGQEALQMLRDAIEELDLAQ